jgi:hypothetical protein
VGILRLFLFTNVAIPPNAVIGEEIFDRQSTTEQHDLLLLFGSIAEINHALRHRFDGLPIHSIVYYQSYNQGVLQHLIAAIIMTVTVFFTSLSYSTILT